MKKNIFIVLLAVILPLLAAITVWGDFTYSGVNPSGLTTTDLQPTYIAATGFTADTTPALSVYVNNDTSQEFQLDLTLNCNNDTQSYCFASLQTDTYLFDYQQLNLGTTTIATDLWLASGDYLLNLGGGLNTDHAAPADISFVFSLTPITVVPEPSTIVLLALAAALLGVCYAIRRHPLHL